MKYAYGGESCGSVVELGNVSAGTVGQLLHVSKA